MESDAVQSLSVKEPDWIAPAKAIFKTCVRNGESETSVGRYVDCLSYGVEADLYVQHDLDLMIDVMKIDVDKAKDGLLDTFTAMDIKKEDLPKIINNVTKKADEARQRPYTEREERLKKVNLSSDMNFAAAMT